MMDPDGTLYTLTDSPLGVLLLARNSQGLTLINFQAGSSPLTPPEAWRQDENGFDETITQLRAYFTGELTSFELPLAPQGTPFQMQVWEALQTIPYGEVISYGGLARRMGRSGRSARAVGAANGQNPLSIVIPCHRVIGSNGDLTGYGGGLSIKAALLALERGEKTWRN